MFRTVDGFFAVGFFPPPRIGSTVVDPQIIGDPRSGGTTIDKFIALAFGHVIKASAEALALVVSNTKTVFERDASFVLLDNRTLRRSRGFNAFRFNPPPSFASELVDPLRDNTTVLIERIALARSHVFKAAIVAVLVVIASTVLYKSNATLFGPNGR